MMVTLVATVSVTKNDCWFVRYEDGVLVIPKALVKSPISAYENTLEVGIIAHLHRSTA